MSNNIFNKINNLYSNSGYFDRYGGNFIMTILVLFITFIIVSYFHVMNHLQPIKRNWNKRKCDPSVMPFAGLINKENGKSGMKYTEDNFTECVQTTFKNVTEYSFVPYYYLMNTMIATFNDLSKAMNSTRATFNDIRGGVKDVGEDVMGRSLNVTIPLMRDFIYIKDIFAKVQGTIAASIYTLFGSYLTLNSFFVLLWELLMGVLAIIVTFIIANFAVGWLFPPSLAAGLAASAFMVVLLVPIIAIKIFMSNTFNYSGSPIPSIPKFKPPPPPSPVKIFKSLFCFGEDTELSMKGGIKKKMKDLQPGEILQDGSIVTDVMKSTSANNEFYKLKGVIVTENHKVYYSDKGWIKAKDHPDSEYIDNYYAPYIYCIGTSNKLIKINGLIFLDWDELDDYDMFYLKTNKELPIEFEKRFNTKLIHRYLDSGLFGDTQITLEDGRNINICDVDVNDILYNGEIVRSIIKVDGKDMENCYAYYYNKKLLLKATENIEFSINCEDTYLGNMYNEINKLKREKLDENPEYLYHLITDKGYFEVNEISVSDYRFTIDKFLPC